MTEQEVLRRLFDINIHKQTFINYLEVVIDENGTVMYAVPSHQEKLIQLACKKLNVSRDELMNLCPPEYYFNFMEWLCQVSRCISVWNKFYIGTLNVKQKEMLKKLAEESLYKGKIEGEDV